MQGYKVSLDNAQHTILVQLVKSCCTLAIVPRYKELLKFNVRELSGFGEGATSATAANKAGRGRNQGPKPAAAAAGNDAEAGGAPAADPTADAAPADADATPADAGKVNSSTAGVEEAAAPTDAAAVPEGPADGDAAAAPPTEAAAEGKEGGAEQQGVEGTEEVQDAT